MGGQTFLGKFMGGKPLTACQDFFFGGEGGGEGDTTVCNANNYDCIFSMFVEKKNN